MSIRNTHERLIDWDVATNRSAGLSWEIRGDKPDGYYKLDGEVLVRLVEDAEKWRSVMKPGQVKFLNDPPVVTQPNMESVVHRLLDRIDRLEQELREVSA